MREFLVADALYWLEEFRVDGRGSTRSRRCSTSTTARARGEWAPNVEGGREDLAAVAFVRELNVGVAEATPAH